MDDLRRELYFSPRKRLPKSRYFFFLLHGVYSCFSQSTDTMQEENKAIGENMEKEYRSEQKHLLSEADICCLRSRLSGLMCRDVHAESSGVYRIRSLYFDTYTDRALAEKLFGTRFREKFRLRCYGEDYSHINLEKKIKNDMGTLKVSAPITSEDCSRLLCGDIDFLRYSEQELLRELYVKMKSELLRPKVIVEYSREAFVCPEGNVRVTFDTDIRSGLSSVDFLDRDLLSVPLGAELNVLEVKYDGFLPEHIAAALNIADRSRCAFSKFAAARRLAYI